MSDQPMRNGWPTMGPRMLVAQTCVACGRLREAQHFSRQSRERGWHSQCMSCVQKRYRAGRTYPDVVARDKVRRARLQESTTESAKRFGYEWTMRDLDEVVEAVEAGLTYAEIAELMGRTMYGVANAMTRYGLRNGWPTRGEWVIRFDQPLAG